MVLLIFHDIRWAWENLGLWNAEILANHGINFGDRQPHDVGPGPAQALHKDGPRLLDAIAASGIVPFAPVEVGAVEALVPRDKRHRCGNRPLKDAAFLGKEEGETGENPMGLSRQESIERPRFVLIVGLVEGPAPKGEQSICREDGKSVIRVKMEVVVQLFAGEPFHLEDGQFAIPGGFIPGIGNGLERNAQGFQENSAPG